MRMTGGMDRVGLTTALLALAISACSGEAPSTTVSAEVDGYATKQALRRQDRPISENRDSSVAETDRARGRQADDSPPPVEVVRVDAEAIRREVLQRALEAQQTPAQLASSRPSTPINSELNQALLKQLDEAQRQLEAARSKLGDSSQDAMFEVATQLLASVRGSLTADASTAGAGIAKMNEQISVVMDSAQAQIDHLRATLPEGSDAEGLLRQLELQQRQLDVARAYAPSASGAASPALTGNELSKLVENGKRSLEAARLRAASLPNAEELLRQIEVAQRQLDEAEELYKENSVPPTK